MDQPPLAPTTTLQQDITHEGQRKISLIWERTQAAIAMLVTLVALIDISLAAFLGPKGEIAVAAMVFVTNAFSLVIGFYFSRTNHAAIGGIGPKPTPEYTGR